MYGQNWDKYYQRTYRQMGTKALWDVPARLAAELDLPQLQAHFNPNLPVLDLGCGTGQQTSFLAKHFEQLIGVDVSAEAVKIANEDYPDPTNFSFSVLDVTNLAGAQQLVKQYGNFNVYMRGLLHQIKDADLADFREVMTTLLGQDGIFYCIEVGEEIRNYFENSSTDFSQLPVRMRQVFISNLPPRGLSLANLSHYFPVTQFHTLGSGESHLSTNLKFPNGLLINIPAVYAVIQAKAT